MNIIAINKPGKFSIESPEIKAEQHYSLKITEGLGLMMGRTTRSGNLSVSNGKAETIIYKDDLERLSGRKNLNCVLFSLTEEKEIINAVVKLNNIKEELS